ncbi:VOC family protein [Sphingomonas mucosissima]|uniref:27 kDa antigen Cfp30B n=1 Tax=Sphingomonas mucosissima TaxID=370959 RepID=A0A245ZJ47_9SPHN|nr:VOC family protein [Sphingomonas mucosissima]OWK29746.1 27 kDa antigen Cfp30B [Sphingomonas mucosissima]
MRNTHGTPIWYELLSTDPDASKTFYEAVIGWTVGPKPEGEMDYRMIEAASGDAVGGLMRLSPEMVQGGGRPMWLFYVGVDDVDATVARINQAGGSVQLPAFDMPGVGRMAMVADPQGNPLYVMRGESDEPSHSWERTGMGKCNWHELSTTDQAGSNGFYADVFGWTYPDRMTMPGDMGDYVFAAVNAEVIGATMKAGSQPPGWLFYFRVPNIEEAAAKVKAGGGMVHAGPMEVPGGDRVIVASDPHGAAFGVVAPGAPA